MTVIAQPPEGKSVPRSTFGKTLQDIADATCDRDSEGRPSAKGQSGVVLGFDQCGKRGDAQGGLAGQGAGFDNLMPDTGRAYLALDG